MSVRGFARRHSLVLLLATAVAIGSLVLAGCGGSSASSTTATGPLVTHVTNSAGNTGQTVQVVMKNRSYQPQQVTVKVGDTVTWVNQDNPQHDVVADNGEFKSDLFASGGTFSFTFTKAGTYPYHCSIHAGMTGTVVVQ